MKTRGRKYKPDLVPPTPPGPNATPAELEAYQAAIAHYGKLTYQRLYYRRRREAVLAAEAASAAVAPSSTVIEEEPEPQPASQPAPSSTELELRAIIQTQKEILDKLLARATPPS